LKNKAGNTDIVKNDVSSEMKDKLGATLENLSQKDAEKYGIAGGVKVVDLGDGLLKNNTRMEKNFIITSVNGQPVKSIDDLMKIFASAGGSTVRIEGIYPGYEGVYGYPLNLNPSSNDDRQNP
jgi:hypothetical protein